MPPSEIDRMDYWMFEEWVKLLNERNKEVEEHEKKQQEQQEKDKNKYMPQMPNMSQFNPNNFKFK